MSDCTEPQTDADGDVMANDTKSRIIIQQCLSAKLQTEPPTGDVSAQYVQIGRGIVIYACFLRGANEETVEKMVKTVLNVRLSEVDDSGKKLVSILELPGDVLIVPQATLGGRVKGRNVQYHSNINKQLGEQLYAKFVQRCTELVERPASANAAAEKVCSVRSGTYGNRQVLNIDTNGPYSHILEI